jgi:hypothetical protein
MTLEQKLITSGFESINERFGFILMLDALGVSHINHTEQRQWLHNRDEMLRHLSEQQKWHLADAKREYNSLQQQSIIAEIPPSILSEYDETIQIYNKIHDNSSFSTFGDTIILYSWIPQDYPEPRLGVNVMSALALSLHEVMRANIKFGLRLRGAMSVGNFFVSDDGNTILGNAVIDAYKLYESVNWMGVVLAPDLAERYMEQVIAIFNTITRDQFFQLNINPKWWESGISFMQLCSIVILRYIRKTLVPIKNKESTKSTYTKKTMWTPTWPRTLHLERITAIAALQVRYPDKQNAQQAFASFMQEGDNAAAQHKEKYNNTIQYFNEMWEELRGM